MDKDTFKVISLYVFGVELDFTKSKNQAEITAAKYLKEPMLIAWYDGVKQQEHPEVPECQHKPGWIAYAEGHGGKVSMNVNDNNNKNVYSFIYADVGENEVVT